METIERKLTTTRGTYTFEELVQHFSYLDGAQIASFFKDINLTVPREIRIKVIKDLLRDRVNETRIERATLADELGYKLTWFEYYSDSQCVNLLEFYNHGGIITRDYITNLWFAILQEFVNREVSEIDLEKLLVLADTANTQRNQIKTLPFNNALNPIFHDEKGKIDGLTQEEFRPVVYRSSTIPEVRGIATKYQVSIPKRLKKSQLLEVIMAELKDRGTYTKELELELASKNILILERYCIDNEIKASTDLKKEEIIEYILKNAKETEMAYYVPTSAIVYDKIATVEESTAPVDEIPAEPEVVEEPVVEEPIEQPVQEPVAEPMVAQTTPVYVSHHDNAYGKPIVIEMKPIEVVVNIDTGVLADILVTCRQNQEDIKRLQSGVPITTQSSVQQTHAHYAGHDEYHTEESVIMTAEDGEVIHIKDYDPKLDTILHSIAEIKEDVEGLKSGVKVIEEDTKKDKKGKGKDADGDKPKKKKRRFWFWFFLIFEILLFLFVLLFLLAIIYYFNNDVPVIAPILDSPVLSWLNNLFQRFIGYIARLRT